jgi:hypothetical protein
MLVLELGSHGEGLPMDARKMLEMTVGSKLMR